MFGLLSTVLFSLFVWWFSTGAILWLDRQHPRTFRSSMIAATGALVIGFYGLGRSAGDASAAGAYCAFTCAILAWGWQEMAFLLGYITGPRQTGCRSGCRGFEHFRHGISAVLYHELALLACAIVVTWLTWGGANQVGTWTFMTLWGLRLSAKLNLFLGVTNSGSEMLPPHLRYLESYFSIRSMNLLFPISITAATVLAAKWWSQALDAPDGSHEATGAALLASLVSLAVVEHWLMVLPFRSSLPWSWHLKLSGIALPTVEKVPPHDAKIRRTHVGENLSIGLRPADSPAEALSG